MKPRASPSASAARRRLGQPPNTRAFRKKSAVIYKRLPNKNGFHKALENFGEHLYLAFIDQWLFIDQHFLHHITIAWVIMVIS